MKLALIALLFGAAGASAQTVWRCGPEGRQYSDKPCDAGTTMTAADRRSSAEVQAARETLARDRALLTELERERHEREREARAQGSGLVGIVAPAQRAELRPKKALKSKKPSSAASDTLTAVVPGSR